jgi:hypothetical protein
VAAPKRAAPRDILGTSYDVDVNAWALEQAAILRAGIWSKLDVEHLADEVEALARTEGHVLGSALRLILLHLLKWEHQPTKRSRSWSTSVRTQRLAVAEQLEDNPSLSRELDGLIAQAYRRARIEAATETKLPERRFPETSPYSFDDLMNHPVPWSPAT